MSTIAGVEMPASPARCPMDPKRKLPIPVVSNFIDDDGVASWNFSAMNARIALQMAQQRRCGVCGESIGYWVTFLGGPDSAKRRAYPEPPLHIECAEASLGLCPYLRNRNTPRSREKRTGPVGTLRPGNSPTRTMDKVIIYITRRYEVFTDPTGRTLAGCVPAPAKELREFGYGEDGLLQRVPAAAIR